MIKRITNPIAIQSQEWLTNALLLPSGFIFNFGMIIGISWSY